MRAEARTAKGYREAMHQGFFDWTVDAERSRFARIFKGMVFADTR